MNDGVLKLVIALLERHGEWLAKSGHWNGFSVVLFALALIRRDRTGRADARQADELYRGGR